MEDLLPLRELRKPTIGSKSSIVTYRLNSLNKNYNIDFDVFLQTKGINLQREFVWTLEQKQELIWSILYERSIPNMSAIELHDEADGKPMFQIIDGKQRLSTMLDFLNNKFPLFINNKLYKYNSLPEEYQREISTYEVKIYMVYEYRNTVITDQEKIDWFKLLNFSGTNQDEQHLQNLELS